MSLNHAAEIKTKSEIHFQDGLPGLPDFHTFEVLKLDADSPFYLLQSLQKEDLVFLAVQPFDFFADYDFTLTDWAVEKLELADPGDAAVLSIVTVKGDIQKATVNLQAPVVINQQKGKAAQVILNDPRYAVRQPLFTQNTPSADDVKSAI